MFEPVPAPRRRPLFAVSAAAHAALAAALVVPPLLATPEPPEPDGFVRIDWIPVLTIDARARPSENSLRRVKEGGPGARAARASDGGARPPAGPRRSQPTGIPELLPAPTGEEPELPFEEWGERSEPSHAGSGRRDGAADDDPGGCEGCSPIPATTRGVTPPVAIETTAPDYPETARRAHFEGAVVLEAIIGVDGLVRDVRVLKGVNPILDPAALEAVRRWRYRAATIGTHPVSVYLRVVITFSLR